MTTATLETKRFTLQVGEQLVELPEASTRNEALRKSGLTPSHWPEAVVSKRQRHVAVAIHRKQSHSTTRHVKKPIPRTKNSKKLSKQPKTVTVKATSNANYCLFCGNPVLALRSTKHFCNGNCRVSYFRQNKSK